jgi:exopolyphosphatase / guanosine-5'-triphosphate,3'-diphosphate pyrophosphatase
LSLGTVRLMERFDIENALSPMQIQCIQARVETQLNRFLPLKSFPVGQRTVLCGGNAETLARLFPHRKWRGIDTLSFAALQRRLMRLTSMTHMERMEAFDVRKDRADVMAVAAVVLSSLAKRWGLRQALVPGVGLKEGVLVDVLASIHGSDAKAHGTERSERESELLAVTRKFASRMGYDQKHCEHIATLGASLFDQLKKLHGMNGRMRLILQLGALLHDIGHAVGRQSHHRIGEYLVRYADLPGISELERNMVACLVRYHSESAPDTGHKIYSSFGPTEQKQVHMLVALLRVADRLDSDHQQLVTGVQLRTTASKIAMQLSMRRSSDLTLWSVERSGALLEEQLGRKLVIGRKPGRPFVM